MRARARRWARRGKRNRYRGAIARLRTEWGGRCKCSGCGECRRDPAGECDRRWKLQFAHVNPTPLSAIARGRGRAERYHDIKRNPECYRLMCWWCHRELDQAPPASAFGPSIYEGLEESA